MEKDFIHGAVLKLTRYDTLETVKNEFVKMKECGLNTVVIWPAAFWWEKKGENYPFDTGKKILELASHYDLKIVMELAGQLSAMEYIPDFLMKAEYHPIKSDGSREFGQNSFGFLNYFHPEVKALICDHYRKAALAYKDYPALLGYDVFNETMYRSFDEYTFNDFRSWLKQKYGTIERLNEVWERTYSDFSQIRYEEWKWMSVMPDADYCIYRKDAIARFMQHWCDSIKSVDTEHLLIADNIHSMICPGINYARPQDDYGLKKFADKIGMSFYPKQMSGTKEPAARWEIFDAFYDASGRDGFLISEMQTHIQAMFNGATCVEPHELKLWCTEAYASGAESIIYWMWRPFDKGIQTMGRGLVNYRGLPTERFDAAKELGTDVFKHGKLSPVRSNIGIVYEPICDDLARKYTEGYGMKGCVYTDSIYGAYKAFYENNVRADIIRLSEISKYKVIIMTDHIVADPKDAQVLAEYVENGGHIIADGRFGVIDSFSQLNSVIPAGDFNAYTGQIYFDTDNRDGTILIDGKTLCGYNGRHICDVTDGDVIGTFKDGKAAIVKKQTEKGSVTTLNTELWRGYFANGNEAAVKYAASIADEHSLYQVQCDTSLKIRISENADNYFVFAFNYGDAPICADIAVNIDGLKHTVSINADTSSADIVKIAKV